MIKISDFRSKISYLYLFSLSSKWSVTIVVSLLQFLLIPLYLKYLGKETFGVITLIQTARQIADVGVGWMIGGALRMLSEMEAKKDSHGFNTIYSAVKISYTCIGLFLIILIWVVLPLFIRDLSADFDLIFSLIIASINTILIYSFSADRAAFGAKKWQFKSDIAYILSQIVTALFSIIFLVRGFGLKEIITSQLFGTISMMLVGFLFWKNSNVDIEFIYSLKDIKRILKKLFRKSSGYFIFGNINTAINYLDIFLLGYLSNSVTVAEYYLLWKIPQFCILFIQQIPYSYTPFFMSLDLSEDINQLKRNYQKGFKYITYLSAFCAIQYALFGKQFMLLWVGDSAPEENYIYLLIALTLFILIISKWPIQLSFSLVNMRVLNKIIFLELILKTTFIIILFPVFGYISPILTNFLIYSFLLIYLYCWAADNSIKKADSRKG